MVISSRPLAAGYLDPTKAERPAQGACFATVRKLSLLALLVGALVITGWAFDIVFLKTGLPGLGATQPMTAIGLMLCALGLGLRTFPQPALRLTASVCAAAVLLIVVVVMAQNALDADWGTDWFLFPHAVLAEQTGPFLRPGRPAGAALIAFALLGTALFLVSADSPLSKRMFVLLSTVGMLGAIATVLAYAFNLRTLYAMGLYAQVGLNASIGLGLLFAGLLARRADLGWMKYLCGSSVGAVSTRRLLPWTVAVLIVLVGIVQVGTHASWYRAELEIALVTMAGIGVLFAGLLSHARRIDELEGKRRGINEELRDSQQRKQEFLVTLAHDLRNPLSPLRNGIEILRRRTARDELLKPTVDMMDRQLKELTQALDSLIDEYGRK